MDPQRRTFIIQVVIVGMGCLILAALAVILFPRFQPASQHKVTLRIEASAGTATIQYSAGTHSQLDSQKTFSTPWEKSWVLERGTQITLTAGNPNQDGTLKCILRLDDKPWKLSSVKMPVDKVACAGIVP